MCYCNMVYDMYNEMLVLVNLARPLLINYLESGFTSCEMYICVIPLNFP